MQKIKYIYTGADITADRKYRYLLWRIWDSEKPKVLFIMLNPSTADEDNDDPTIKRCASFASSWGFGGMYVANLFAYRTSSPLELKTVAQDNGLDYVVGPNNNSQIGYILKHSEKIVYAWGSNAKLIDPKYVLKFLQWFPDGYCIKKTEKGDPGHPLYLSDDLKLEVF